MIAMWSMLLLSLPQGPVPAVDRLVTGAVVDARGDVVPAAEVWLADANDPTSVVARGRTDGEGRYRLRGPTSPLRVHATAPGKVHRHVWLMDPGSTEADVAVLWDSLPLTGRVLHKDGSPAKGAMVAVGAQRGWAVGVDPVETTTDTDGRYRLEHAPLGEVWLSAWMPGYSAMVRTAGPRRSADEDFRFDDAEPRGFTVAVTGLPEGVSAAGWLVRLTHESGPERVLPRAMTRGHLGADGTWSVFGLPADQGFHLEVVDPARRVACSRAAWSRPNQPERFELTTTGIESGTWHVTLVDPAGKAIAGERLLLGLCGTTRIVTTAADGTASLTAPQSGYVGCSARILESSEWVLREKDSDGDAREGGPIFRSRQVEAVTLHAISAARLRGVLNDAEGRPIAGRTVILQDRLEGRFPRWLRVTATSTDAAGGFEYSGQFPSTRPHRLMVPGVGVLAVSALVGGEVQDLGQVVVPRAGVLAGVAMDAAGRPLPGARVFLVQRGKDGDHAELIADAAGRFQLTLAAGGNWHGGLNWCEQEFFESVGGDVLVRDGETVTLELRSAH